MKKISCLLVLAVLIGIVAPLVGCSKKKSERSFYDILITYDGATSVVGTVDFTFINQTENELSDLKFNLYGNAYREDATVSPIDKAYEGRAFYAGESYGSMKIAGVENCAGWNVGGEDMNLLTVNLLEPVYPEQRVKIKIDYTLELAKVNHRTGVCENTVNLGNFYPVLCVYEEAGFVECPYYSCGDPFLSDCANYKVNLNLPPEYTAASSGKLINESSSGERKTLTYELENARDFALVLSDKFQVLTADAAGVTVNYYYVKDAHAEGSLNAACRSIQYFQEGFGKYVYPQISVVETGFCYGGMEYPGLTMISDTLDEDNYIYTIVHENAHQWWYAMVGSNQLNCAWQDEGLAEYSTVLFFENTPEYGFTRTGMVGSAVKQYRAYFSVYNQIFGGADTTMNRHLKEYTSDYEYANISYNKGLILFDTLRNSMGDSKFLAALKKYYADNLYKIAGYSAICEAFKSTGLDAEPFFNSFVEGKIII